MNMIDAVTNMLAGKRLYRPSWNGYTVSIIPNQTYIWSIPNSGDKAAVNATVYTASVDDLVASDWTVKIN